MMGDNAALSLVEERCVAVLKVKADKFKRLMQNDDAAEALVNFMNNENVKTVFIADGAKEMATYEVPPTNTKKKVLYLLKPEDMSVNTAEAFSSLTIGDISPRLLENMYAVLEGVYLPIMSNPANQKACPANRAPAPRPTGPPHRPAPRPQGWPEVMSHEVLELFHKTVAGVYVALGQSVGMTLLPQPPAEMLAADRASKDKDRVHVLETAVVMWTAQIKSVLKTDPESVLMGGGGEGEHPGPLEGLEFWVSKSANLKRIIQQLDSDKIRKVMKVLELTKSPYYTAFSALIKEVTFIAQHERSIA
jgi:dynein heavy chain